MRFDCCDCEKRLVDVTYAWLIVDAQIQNSLIAELANAIYHILSTSLRVQPSLKWVNEFSAGLVADIDRLL